ncbi:hypothetical protein PATSB16_43420 [Pandoraea thiooxydans]|uniref:Transglutaminase n=1 Tax=Pandoraea thiooxydans TaxID=445709 RepID=A0A0G3ES90_9BURK|nr:transglutaminase family protein [Pandoraea thiooxydans]AKJ69903.1 transglutaminase [Pandoraea thiooxydans]APR97676.1 hypothetical protein PATSB16_43420 [Pandoraea thiooxydans]
MRLKIRHETTYRYAAQGYYTIQQLRLTPRTEVHQRVIDWRISAPDKLTPAEDTFGNTMHTLVIHHPHDSIYLLAVGEVETTPLNEGRLDEGEGRLPLLQYTCATRLTEADDTILALSAGTAFNTPQDLLRLAETILGRVEYESGVTEVTSSASHALALGRGVCQDHAHLMLACCRAHGVPARYVSGYIDPGDVPHAASHAWADVWLDGYGWVSVDVTHARYASGNYCRLAIGRDYDSAAPVRGMRVGGATEHLSVKVSVDSLDQ